MTLFHTDHWI